MLRHSFKRNYNEKVGCGQVRQGHEALSNLPGRKWRNLKIIQDRPVLLSVKQPTGARRRRCFVSSAGLSCSVALYGKCFGEGELSGPWLRGARVLFLCPRCGGGVPGHSTCQFL